MRAPVEQAFGEFLKMIGNFRRLSVFTILPQIRGHSSSVFAELSFRLFGKHQITLAERLTVTVNLQST